MSRTRASFIVSIVVATAFVRLMPHPPNMTPVVGAALFAGAAVGDKRIAIIAPLLALFVTDVALGFYPHMEIVYAAVVLVTLSGFLAENGSAFRIGCLALSGSLLFYFVTNAGVWAFDGLYPHSLAGLATCYLMGLPFLGNQLIGDALTVFVLFGGLHALERPRIVHSSKFSSLRQA